VEAETMIRLNRNRTLSTRSIRRLAAGLGTMAMALSFAALELAGTGPADAATAPASAVTIHPISLNSANFSPSAGFGSREPAWYRDSSGVIHLQGAATQTSTAGSTPNLIGTLPTAARPAADVYTIVHTFNGTYADLAIDSNGQISLINPRPPAIQDYSFVSLESITYRPALAGSFIQVAGPDWSGIPTFGSRDAKWYKDSSGVIHLQGSVSQIHTIGSDPNMLGLLPAAARPTANLFFIVHTFNGTYADLSIDTSGNISVINPRPPAVQDYSFVSLEGISYQLKPAGNVATIGPDWAQFAGFGARVPAWFKDKSGIVHLEGAAMQTSTGGSTPNLVATLQPAARPASTVYTVVHTFNGTYADLAIEPNGQIFVINPRPPAVQDYNFVSLEGITYHR
jgi:hypothetical protein